MGEKVDSSYILITIIDSMGSPEEIKKFDKKTNDDHGKWIQIGSFKIQS